MTALTVFHDGIKLSMRHSARRLISALTSASLSMPTAKSFKSSAAVGAPDDEAERVFPFLF